MESRNMELPPPPPKSPVVRQSRVTRFPAKFAATLFFLLLLVPKPGAVATEPLFPTAQTNSRAGSQFKYLDYYQLEQFKRHARENADRHRIRVAVPPSALEDISQYRTPGRSGAIRGGNGPEVIPTAESSPWLVNLAGTFVLLGMGLLAARKYVPGFAEYIAAFANTPAIIRSAGLGKAGVLLAEHESVLEFQTRFQVRPDSPAAEKDGGGANSVPESALQKTLACLAAIQKQLESLRLCPTDATRQNMLYEIQDHFMKLKGLADDPQLVPLQQLACAMEMLNKQLMEKTANVNSSTLRTFGLGLEALVELCKPGLNPNLLNDPPLRFLAVDDEAFSRYALSITLKRTLSAPDMAVDGESAMKLAAEQSYDLILLDVQMPGMDGFELCSKIHETAANRATPVVFVTSMSDFDTRSKSILCGGRDLIAKPFLTFELTVKALTLVAHERLRGRGRNAAAANPEPAREVQALPAPELSGPVENKSGGKKIQPQVAEPAKPALPPAKIKLEKPADAGDRKETPAEFLAQAGLQAGKFLEVLDYLQQTPDQKAQQEMLSDLFIRANALAKRAENSGIEAVAQIYSATESLLKKILQDAKHLNSSTLQTLALAANLVKELGAKESGQLSSVIGQINAIAVDDDPIALRALCNALQLRFPKPATAPDGETALKLLGEKPFDIVFLDVQMPGLDGFEVCQFIRATPAIASIPVVFVTGNDKPAVREKAVDSGGNDFITKPCLGAELSLKALTLVFRSRLCHPKSQPLSVEKNEEQPQNAEPAAV